VIEWSDTQRGFRLGTFRDTGGETCSVQASSIATEERVWVGLDDPRAVHVAGAPRRFELPAGVTIFGRMHLNREQAGQLAEVLARFAETGELP
jgi:hypothetical protein